MTTSPHEQDIKIAAPERGRSSWLRAALRVLGRRAPVLLQSTTTECGAACLAMILSHHGRATSVSECREIFGTGRDGTKATSIIHAARVLGLVPRAFSTDLDHFGQIPLPAIVHWSFNHFVVVERWSHRGVWVLDPAYGRRRLSRDEFSDGFTGVALTFEPGPDFKRGGVHRSASRALFLHFLRAPGVKGALGQVLGASMLLQLLGLAVPLATQMLVDKVLPLQLIGAMGILGAGIAIVAMAQLSIGFLRSAFLIYLQGRFDERMMLGIFEHLLSLPFHFFHQRTSGDLLTRLGSTAVLREILTNQTLSVILDGVLVVGYLALLLASAPLFGALALALGLLQVVLMLGTAERMRDLTQQHLIANAESQSLALQVLKGIASVKASAAEPLAFRVWSGLFFKQLNISIQRGNLMAIVNTCLGTLRTTAPLLLLWVGARQVLDGSMTLGTMLALNAIAAAFLAPLSNLVATGQQINLAAAHFERVFDILETKPELAAPAGDAPRKLHGDIVLDGVCFRYDRSAPLVLKNITVTIQRGQKVAIVGATGSGKSTLALLLLGLYTPTEGRILYDGVPLADLDLRGVRRQFGVVLQDTILFSGSIRQNVSQNDPTISLERITDALQLAGMGDEVKQMPLQFDTVLGEGGLGLSGGQRQRLSLARALASRPALLLLDEATSHLDAVTEALVDENLNRLSCTRIVIAHRLSTIRNADLIVVLFQGEVVERGTHADLMAIGGRYAALVSGQESLRAAGAGDPAETAPGTRDTPRIPSQPSKPQQQSVTETV